jgi:gluconate 2-dehydrogenase gamma chain
MPFAFLAQSSDYLLIRVMDLSRRSWIVGSLGSTAFAAIAAAQEHASRALKATTPVAFEFFDEATAAEISAISEQILPSDDGPGAKEAGVIYFIDRALTTFDSDKKDIYTKGLAVAQDVRRRLFPDSSSIASLSSEQQVRLLHTLDKSDFFEAVRIHTLMGFLGNPSYGGNKAKVGWKHIGFDDKMSFQPPFGFYDAEVK